MLHTAERNSSVSGYHPRDVRIFTTNPRDLASPFDARHPEDIVFCCFFRELEQRAAFLKQTRFIAGTPLTVEADTQTLTEQLADEYRALQSAGNAQEAVYTAVRWWSGILRRGYHTYSLKIGFAPYRTSCILSFQELDTDSIRYNLSRALQMLEQDKGRVIDFFGFGGSGGRN